jgi:hypothetical protein
MSLGDRRLAAMLATGIVAGPRSNEDALIPKRAKRVRT